MKRAAIIVRDVAGRQIVQNHIDGLNLDKPWAITIEPHRKKRSLSQNALAWKWVGEVAEHVREYTGQDAKDVHEFFNAEFLPWKIIEIAGKVHKVPGSTTDLDTTEMSDYLTRIYIWATTELGMMLPHPDDLGRPHD